MKGTKKLIENKDWEACDSTLQIGHVFGRNGVQQDFYPKDPNSRFDDKQEKQAKKDYYEASDSVLEIGHHLLSNKVQRELHTNSSKMSLWR